MKSLIKKKEQIQSEKNKSGKSKAQPKIEAVAATTRTEAQCCAKVSRTAVGCHD